MVIRTMDPFMQAAIKQAKKSREEGGIPIGSVLVKDGTIVGHGHNQRVQQNNPILHAEIDCLQNAGRVGNYAGTTLYSTLCPVTCVQEPWCNSRSPGSLSVNPKRLLVHQNS